MAAYVKEKLNIPVVTGMYRNPKADMYKTDIYIISTRNSAAGMRDAKKMAALAPKMLKNEKIGASSEEDYIPQGKRVNL